MPYNPECPTQIEPARINAASGSRICDVLADTKAKGITININPKVTTSVDDILEALRPVLENAKSAR